MTVTLCSEQNVIEKAGANANATAVASSALLTSFINQAEGTICSETRRDWVTNYASIASDLTKEALKNAVSAEAAKLVIMYDMSGFTSRQEAEIMLDVLHDQMLRATKILTDLDSIQFRGVTD